MSQSSKAEGLSPTLRDEAIRWRENRCGHTGGPDASLEPYCCRECVEDAEKNVLPLLEHVASLAVQERRQTWGHCGNCGGTEFVVVETCETCGMSEQLERVKGQAQHPPEETR